MTSQLSLLFHKIFRSRKISIFLLAVIFLPGTLIHEFSHAVMAKLLLVHVGKMELMPSLSGESLKLGSVEVGHTDIIRNFLIGIAPFIAGTSLLLGALYYFTSNEMFGVNLFTFLILLFTFIVSNTMYSSKKDMEGAVEFFLLVIAPIIVLYYFGVRIPGFSFEIFKDPAINSYFKTVSILLGIPIVLDFLIIGISKTLVRE